MSDVVQIDGLAEAIAHNLQAHTDDVTVGVKAAVDQVANEVNQEIKDHATFHQRTGDYVRAFKIKKSYEDKYNKRKTWYVASPHYRLTHLLEHGHAKRNGGRTRAFPHIIYGEELAQRNLPERIKQVIDRGH